MTPRNQRSLTILLLIAVICAFLWDVLPLHDAQARILALPKDGLGFSSQKMELNETEKVVYGEAQVLKSVYQTAWGNFLLILVDGSRNRHAIHDPTYCFTGAGWKVVDRRTVAVPSGKIGVLTLQKGPENRMAAYWFSDGKTRHNSALQCWWQTAKRRLTFGTISEEPILAVLQPLEKNPSTENWDKLSIRLPFLFNF